MRVALVHDYLVQYGGAERVLEVLTEMYPEAPIYTLIYDPNNLYGAFSGKRIHTSFLQNMPFARKHHRFFPHLMPMAVEDFDFSKFDLVISSTNSYAKGVITGPETLHISYCHTPMRYAWDDCHRYLNEFRYSSLVKKMIPFALNYLRMWDKVSSDRVDVYIANSKTVQRRIQKYYNAPAKVMYPPVNVESFFAPQYKQLPQEDYYFMLGRFLPYKHYDIVIEAFLSNGKQLKILGSGPEERYLKDLAGSSPNIEFLGRLNDEQSRQYFSKAKAFIFPSEDDFGIVPVEAMAAGRPVIAYGAGGALETVIEGKTGIFFEEQNSTSVENAVNRFETMKFDSTFIREHAKSFDKARFASELQAFIDAQIADYF
jgi:glycosyltransferase involved in cell wall biosynthesis